MEEKLSCRMLRESVSRPNWNGTFNLSPLLKLPPRTLEPRFVLLSFVILYLIFMSTNQPYSAAWNIVATSELVLSATTRIC